MTAPAGGKPAFFETPAGFRRWLQRNHDKATELLVGFYKKGSGHRSITWRESVDQALCFGWIDGVRKGIDDVSYTIRFTPRKRSSTWSAINIRRFGELTALGLTRPAGLRAFEQRTAAKSGIYSYENPPKQLPAADEKKFRANRKAWTYFTSQAPWYRRVAIHWVVTAKREQTHARRLALLIEDSASGRRLAALDAGRARPRRIPYDRIRKLCLSLPGVSEKASHGSPTFWVAKRTFLSFANNHHGDGRIAIWCNASEGGQEILVGSDPENFFVPPYVGVRGWIGVRLDRGLSWEAITAVVKDAYAATGG